VPQEPVVQVQVPFRAMNVATELWIFLVTTHDWNSMRRLWTGPISGEMFYYPPASGATATVTKAFRQQDACNDHEVQQIQLQALYMVNSNQPGRSERR